jgi:hypothetical protein
MRAAVREYCDKNVNCKNFVKLHAWERSKIYQKFFHFLKAETDDNLEGFLIGILFLSNNRRIEKVRQIIKSFLTEGVFGRKIVVYQLIKVLFSKPCRIYLSFTTIWKI